jgi:phosphoglycolate phosphatase-like HAD superfamily hydrolase
MFNLESDFLALDFDGVIADSIGECLVIGHNAYVMYTQAGQQICRLEELNKTHMDECRRLRNFIRSGEDYVYINLAIDNRARIENQQEYDSFVNKHLNLKDTFYDLFYREREFFSSTKEDLWIELNPLYRGIKQFLLQYQFKERLFIITTKKIKYALKILTGNRIYLKEENCFCASGRDTKLKIIKSLLYRNNISSDNFYYIDDQIDTLIEVKKSGVHCILAEWGYTTPQQILRAENENIAGIQLNDFLIQFSAKPGF